MSVKRILVSTALASSLLMMLFFFTARRPDFTGAPGACEQRQRAIANGQHAACERDEDCTSLALHSTDECYHFVNRKDVAALRRMDDEWTSAGCLAGRPRIECPDPPVAGVCREQHCDGRGIPIPPPPRH
jgi:hypothetical protein